MRTLDFIGPIPFSRIDAVEQQTNGVYLWCVKGDDGLHRVHYIGEAGDIARRLNDHRRSQLAGRYTGFCPDALRRNIKVLKHRANRGMIARYASEDRSEFNQKLLAAIDIFYAKLQPGTEPPLRCRYEYALYMAVEDYGQNILSVGYLRTPNGEPFDVLINTGSSEIEALTHATIRV